MLSPGWSVVTIRREIHAKVNELITNAQWNEPRTISGFVEDAVTKEIKRVERIRRKTDPLKVSQ